MPAFRVRCTCLLLVLSGVIATCPLGFAQDAPADLPKPQRLSIRSARPEPIQQRLESPRVRAVPLRMVVRAEAPVGQLRDQVSAQRQSYLDSLKQLQDAYCRSGQLDEAVAVRDLIRQVEAQAQVVSGLVAPNDSLDQTRRTVIDSTESISSLRGQNEQAFYRRVTGRIDGSVWGGENDLYTDDSDLATAAVHSGVLAPGTTAVVKLTILPGQKNYASISRNDIESRAWESWGGSFRIDGAGYEIDYATELRGQTGPIPVFVKTASTGNVWGSSPYTDDSALGAVAIHSGLLQPGESGLLLLNPLPGQDSYSGSVRNGITSSDYRSFAGSMLLQEYVRPDKGLPPRQVPAATKQLGGVTFRSMYSETGFVRPSILEKSQFFR